MDKTDITIIGAGVIGLAIAAEVARPDLSFFILEKNTSHGGGISSRNSEVIHAGIYYPAGSLKAELCVVGRQLLYDIAAKYGIPHKKTGKLIVATGTDEIDDIERLEANGRQNGVTYRPFQTTSVLPSVCRLEVGDTAGWKPALQLGRVAHPVAQTSSLLYRGFPTRRARPFQTTWVLPTVCRLEVGDTAGWKPALRSSRRSMVPRVP